MQIQSFALGLRTVSGFLPYAKKLADDEIKFLWLLIPQQVKDDVSDDVWAYACNQRLLDPNPDKEQALHLQLLKYVYRTRDGQPAFDWGFKEDLPQRMSAGAVFQCLTPKQGQQAIASVQDGPTHHLLQGLTQ